MRQPQHNRMSFGGFTSRHNHNYKATPRMSFGGCMPRSQANDTRPAPAHCSDETTQSSGLSAEQQISDGNGEAPSTGTVPALPGSSAPAQPAKQLRREPEELSVGEQPNNSTVCSVQGVPTALADKPVTTATADADKPVTAAVSDGPTPLQVKEGWIVSGLSIPCRRRTKRARQQQGQNAVPQCVQVSYCGSCGRNVQFFSQSHDGLPRY